MLRQIDVSRYFSTAAVSLVTTYPGLLRTATTVDGRSETGLLRCYSALSQPLAGQWDRRPSRPVPAAGVGPRLGPPARVSPASRGGGTRRPLHWRGRACHPERRGPDRSDLADATPPRSARATAPGTRDCPCGNRRGCGG